ncbi:proline dehydrogenase family protein [Phytoactinopolyspora halotolerans]|uniref:proline dehydrogenase n=1 Tax=Phytoactinopolyspora halotolerans TaxID=1981512 RepID=A0A6L9SCT5_9ACTN|nr:proline dehydrogenase family protein [Phytoactinopolyspora halotolerans]NEE02378.1 proline dehydrogenase [Phytoactinopolyspora halotolerans]
MLGPTLLAASRSARVKRLVTSAPVARQLVARFVAGEADDAAADATRRLIGSGLAVTIDRLGEDVLDAGHAQETQAAYVRLLNRLAEDGLAAGAEVSLKLSAVGQALPGDGERVALDHARAICATAQRAGTTVTVDMEDHTTVDSTLSIVGELRADFPWVGAVLQSCLRRTEADCRALAVAGSRVRLVKGAYAEPSSVAYPAKHDVDRAYARCLRILMASPAYPMVATHDPRMLRLADALASRYGRGPENFEYQMLYGVRPREQRKLAASGARVRIYLPYGADWYGYLMRRLAERPANVAFFARSALSR